MERMKKPWLETGSEYKALATSLFEIMRGKIKELENKTEGNNTSRDREGFVL